jgi:hypothetical protein
MQAYEVDSKCAKLFQRIHEMAQAASEAVVALDKYDVHATATAVGQQAVELWPALLRP